MGKFLDAGGSGGRPIGRGNDSHADGWADAPPIVVVAKSAQLRFRLRRKLRPLPCSSSPHRAGRGGGPFRSCQKRNGPCTVQREKTLRRVGLRKRSPPAAGGGWLAVPCGSQRRKRVWARGSLGYTLRRFSLPLAWWLMGLLQRADEDIGPYGNAESHSPAVGADAHIRPLVQTPTTARVARSEAERAEREAGQMRSCTPTNHRTRAAGIRHQACTAPRRARRTVTRRHHLTPTPVARGGPLHRSASKRLFLLHRARRILFLGKTKKRMGAHPPVETAPLREQPPWPLFSGRKRKRTAFRRSKRPLMPGDGPSDTHPSAAASPHGCRSGWTRCPHGPASPEWSAGPHRSPADGRRRSGAGCGA